MIRIARNNNEYVYILSENTCRYAGYGFTKSYSIIIIGETERVIAEDISDDFRFVRDLFDVIVEEELYPQHLLEVVEDYLSGNYPKIIPIDSKSGFSYIA